MADPYLDAEGNLFFPSDEASDPFSVWLGLGGVYNPDAAAIAFGQETADMLYKWAAEHPEGKNFFQQAGNAITDLGSSISNAVSNVGKSVESAATSVGKTLEAIAKNPLPAIETVVLIYIGVPPPLASAVVTAANGGNMDQIATAAVATYVGGQVSNYVQGEISSTVQPTQGAYIPSNTESLVIKAASSAIGADVGATTAALASGKPLDQALEIGSKAAVTSLASSAGQAVGSEVASNIEDPTLAKIVSGATKGGVTAGLTGQDVVQGATSGATQPLRDAAGNAISQYAPDLSGVGNVDLSGIKEAIKPISDAATAILQPLEQPVKDVVQAGADTATKVLQPLEQPIKDVGTSIAGAAKDITSDLPNVTIPKIDKDVMQAISNQYSSKPQGSSDLTSPSIATTGSPASYAGEDIAILGDTPGSLGSKVNKKGGKYPWGDPEGTTALKEGLGV